MAFLSQFQITPIHCAFEGNCLELAKILVEKGADPNVIGPV